MSSQPTPPTSWRGAAAGTNNNATSSASTPASSSWRGAAAPAGSERPKWTRSGGGNDDSTPSSFAASLRNRNTPAGDMSSGPRSSMASSRREPDRLNSRAAGLEAIGGGGGDTRSARRDTPRDSSYTPDQGPPPVLNKRFADLSTGGGDDAGSSMRGGPPRSAMATPLVANSRFSAVADDRGPGSSSMGSRFGAGAGAERTPPNSGMGGGGGTGGGTWSSRFSGGGGPSTGQREQNLGPPPTTNSRFAKAAEMAGRDDRSRGGGAGGFGGDRGGGGGYGGDRGGYGGDRRNQDAPLAQNSRFANAAADDPDYVERGERERRMQERDRDGYDGGRGGGGGRGGFRNDRMGGGGRGGMDMPLPTGPRGSETAEAYSQGPRVEEILKTKLKKEDEVVLKPPTKMHEENMLKFPAKALTKEDDTLFPTKKKETEPEPAKVETAAVTAALVANVEELMARSDELLKEFATGSKQGEELAKWVQENKVGLPAVDKLVFELLMENEKLNPDPECPWAESSNFGAALLSLVEDDVVGQMQILWGIQLYCDKIGFPKLDGESICQAMFRSMYKNDLASVEAFMEWKEDESDQHMAGKTSAIIQTTDWFAWLEEDDEDEEEEDEEY